MCICNHLMGSQWSGTCSPQHKNTASPPLWNANDAARCSSCSGCQPLIYLAFVFRLYKVNSEIVSLLFFSLQRSSERHFNFNTKNNSRSMKFVTLLHCFPLDFVIFLMWNNVNGTSKLLEIQKVNFDSIRACQVLNSIEWSERLVTTFVAVRTANHWIESE